MDAETETRLANNSDLEARAREVVDQLEDWFASSAAPPYFSLPEWGRNEAIGIMIEVLEGKVGT